MPENQIDKTRANKDKTATSRTQAKTTSKNPKPTPQCIYFEKKHNSSHLKSKLGVKRTVTENTNAVLIGKKPIMNYVLACITFFHGGAKEVSIKARGRSISRAIDVAEVVRHRFLPDVKIKSIGIGTDQFLPQDSEEGNQGTNVSTIEITLMR
jgi:DNA-binding protein